MQRTHLKIKETRAREHFHLGSVLNSEIAGSKYAYDAFGQPFASVAAIGYSSNPVQLGWQGLQYDQAGGNYDNGARDYDPRTGRFLTKDPIGFRSGEINLYRSRNNNPLSFFDPTGFAAMSAGGTGSDNSNAGVAVLVNSYLKEAGGNVSDAWRKAERDRSTGSSSAEVVALAEHYLYSLNEVLNGGKTEAVKYILVLIPGYTSVKAIEQTLGIFIVTDSNASPASLREIEWGVKGALDACGKNN